MTVSRFSLGTERTMGWALAGFAFFAVASIALQNLVFVAAAAWILGMALQRQWRIVPTPMNWTLLWLAATLVASSVLDGRLNASFFGLRKIGLMLVFFVTAATAGHPVKVVRYLDFFLAGTVVSALGSLVAHALGWDGGRATSFSGDYMAAGGMYMLGFILLASRFMYAPRASRLWWLAGMLVVGMALLLTYTRSSWIGAAVGLMVLGVLRDWRLPVAVFAAGLILLLVFPKSYFSERVHALSVQSTITSNTERKMMWVSGLKMLQERLWQGYGVDNLSEHYAKYANPQAIEQRPPHVHNTVLQLALNGGLLAAGAYLWWVVVVVVFGLTAWAFNRKAAPDRAGVALGITSAFIGFVVNGFFEFNFGTAQVITIVYFLTGLLPAMAFWDPQGPLWPLPPNPKVLFIRPRFRGDVLLASPMPRLIKRDYPKAQVDLLTEPAAVGAAAGEPEWNRIFSLPRHDALAWWRMVRNLRAGQYDVVCDLFGNPRTAVLSAMSGARMTIGPRVRVWEMLYGIRTQAHQPGPRPAWESYYDTLRVLGIHQLSLRPRWEVKAEDDRWVLEFLKERKVGSGKILGVFPGGSHPAKRWPLEQFIEVARRAPRELGLKAIFVFGPLEKDLKDDYARAGGKMSLSVEGLPPGRLAALWAHSAVVLSNDAFPMHLGPAVGTPTVGLFGPGEPEIWFPYARRNGHQALFQHPVCWPCHKDECEKTECWNSLTPDRVIHTVAEILRDRVKPQRASGRFRPSSQGGAGAPPASHGPRT